MRKKKIYRNPVSTSKYTGLFLISPFLIGFTVFILYPFISSFVISLYDCKMNLEPDFIGLGNYKEIISDKEVINALGVTLKYVVILVPLKMFFSLMVALILNMEIKCIGLFRMIYYIPSILGSNIAIVILWRYLFTSDGLVNQLISLAGAAPISWYGEPTPALFTIVLLRVWEFGSCMVVFLAALRDIPKELYEAAKVDGCNKLTAFFKITLPSIKNIILMNFIIQLINAFQEFNAPFLITGGNPLKKTYTYAMLIYDEAFGYNNFGYANALSWILFTITFVVIILTLKLLNRMKKD
ncbi:MAG: sugar ABC transporter permease [Ruminococcus sp.]|nr:sugar ABC transporter permease [Ruminococcus sp.]